MNRELPPLASRALAVAILFALVGGIWLGLGQPVVDRFVAYRARVAEAEDRLPRLRRLAASAPVLEQQLARMRRDPSARTRELSGASDALAAADLQNRVSRIASNQGAVLRSTQILPPTESEGFRRIAIRVAMETNTPSLQKIFYQLETSSTLLFLDSVEIRSRSGGRVQRTPARNNKASDRLSVRFELFGYTAVKEP